MKRHKRVRLLSAQNLAMSLLLFVSTSISANVPNLTSRDYLSVGDNLLTFDTSTNLEWLDISFTVGLTIDAGESLSLFDADGTAGKFRWATPSEIQHLINHIPPLDGDFGLFEMFEQRVSDAEALIDMLGATYTSPPFDFRGVEGMSRELQFVDISSGDVSYSYALVYAFRPYTVIGLDGPACCVAPNAIDANSINRGLWLVREASPVPIPSALTMFGAATLLGIVRLRTSRQGAVHRRRKPQIFPNQ